MENLRLIIARNITELRREAGLTQLELAEKLNYSDKAVSKWERAESVPDIAVLKAVADLFGVTVDELISEKGIAARNNVKKPSAKNGRSNKRVSIDVTHAIFICMSVFLVWLVGTVAFVLMYVVQGAVGRNWLSFIYCVPLSFIVWLVFNCVWFKGRYNYIIVSALLWTVLTSFHVTLVTFGFNFWLLYILGIPCQAIIFAWAALEWKLKKDRANAELSVEETVAQ